MNPELTIDADFPGGNILMAEYNGNIVILRQGLPDTVGGWFYWAFQVPDAQGQHLTFHFTGAFHWRRCARGCMALP